MWKRATEDELLKVFYLGYCSDGKVTTGCERNQVIRKARVSREAIMVMTSDYLQLIPLHNIQIK